ncbi:gluconeogenesis factor YvcK family protein [Dermabacteraceae bacterium P13103]
MARKNRRQRAPRVVAFGGGHGLAANLKALRHITQDLTAVVTVADNGGSSGRLREHMPVLPPGDLRMALAALCDDTSAGHMWRDVIQHRFENAGELEGHAVGNLLIVALWQLLDDPVEGLKYVGDLLGARGRVLPMALDPLHIEADVRVAGELRKVRGQAQVAAADGYVEEVRLLPANPRVPQQVLDAVERADWLIFGPGSWFTSVLPHLMVPDLADAVASSCARRMVTMNLSAGVSEAEGRNFADLLDVLCAQRPDIRYHALLADPSCLADPALMRKRTEKHGTELVLRSVGVSGNVPEHEPLRLASAYRDVFDMFAREEAH